jgi:hypothetical protein
MITGKGALITRSQRIALNYQLSTKGGKVRTGNLICDTSALDHGIFCERLTLECEDGTAIDIAVTCIGDRHMCFVGNVLAAA